MQIIIFISVTWSNFFERFYDVESTQVRVEKNFLGKRIVPKHLNLISITIIIIPNIVSHSILIDIHSCQNDFTGSSAIFILFFQFKQII